MLPLPLVLVRRLVTSFVSPVLHGPSPNHGVCFSVVPQEPWHRLCNQVHDMCFGKSRVLASKHLILANSLGSHMWRPDGYSVMEMARVIHRVLTAPAGIELATQAIRVATLQPEAAPPLWRSWVTWIHSFGATFDQCNVFWEGNLVLHHGLSIGMWEHECRRLLSASSINLARKMDRGLAEFCCASFDSFLMHHVTCCSSESNGAETFACGGVNCRDRHHRHLRQGSSVCEHEGCAQNDTPSHRLYTCKGTDDARSKTGWLAEH
eukprot:440420-Amphidinium_carterae.3